MRRREVPSPQLRVYLVGVFGEAPDGEVAGEVGLGFDLAGDHTDVANRGVVVLEHLAADC